MPMKIQVEDAVIDTEGSVVGNADSCSGPCGGAVPMPPMSWSSPSVGAVSDEHDGGKPEAPIAPGLRQITERIPQARPQGTWSSTGRALTALPNVRAPGPANDLAGLPMPLAALAAAAPATGAPWGTARWHKSAESVGILSEDNHVFTKTAGPRLRRTHDSGAGYELATICMVFDASLRCGGSHNYRFCFLDGELGRADGAGFVFDTKVRRRPLGQMHAVFLNQRGCVCLRRGKHVTRLPVQLPHLALGMCLTMSVSLDRCMARFDITDFEGVAKGSADVSLEGLFEGETTQLLSGFFCAVVTGNITVGLY